MILVDVERRKRGSLERGYIMQEIIKEYGPALITIVAIIALIIIVKALVGNGTDGIIGQAFKGMIDSMANKAKSANGVILPGAGLGKCIPGLLF